MGERRRGFWRALWQMWRCKHEWKTVTLGGNEWTNGHIHYVIGRRDVEFCLRCGKQAYIPFFPAFDPIDEDK